MEEDCEGNRENIHCNGVSEGDETLLTETLQQGSRKPSTCCAHHTPPGPSPHHTTPALGTLVGTCYTTHMTSGNIPEADISSQQPDHRHDLSVQSRF
ncbi:hypothetical protein E2C01_004764 [Portunus trituberculatus]|uniref:Uncharacterized protein n=1 Tax=Portunus trituberculatus TaxID=210409 RepID=A0A5B7CQI9_PORTR|nr:hypothetical protein [Portunus trituberculatus]